MTSNGISFLKKVATLSLVITLIFGNFPFGLLKAPKAHAATVIYLLVADNGSPWDVPADWNDNNNSIEVIGAGGGGSNLAASAGGGGGGGGAYSRSNNVDLNPAVDAEFTVGGGGGTETAGGDTWFCDDTTSCANFTDSNVVVSADGGSGANTSTNAGGPGGTLGGITNASIEFAGGTGGDGSGNIGDLSTGGGGGAGSPNGTGGAGGAGDASSGGEEGMGGGGASGDDAGATDDGVDGGANGGNGGDSNGNTNSGGAGGNGGNGNPGTDGGGGGGGDGAEASDFDGGDGGDGQEWDATHGAGGGGGGGDEDGAGVGGNGGLYGAGGGGGGTPGAGADGIIVITYEPVVSPTVSTQSASSVTQTTATLNGTIVATGGADATVRGFAWGTNSNLSGGDTATTSDTVGQPFGTGTFTESSLTLTCNTTYYSRAYATNSAGTGYGSISASFTTSPCDPTVTTQSATSVGATSATLNGTIVATGGANATVRGFAWGTSATMNGDTATTTDTVGQPFGTGAFTESSLTLLCGTTYYSRAYATNPGGTGLGEISASFSTAGCSPTVSTQSASNVGRTTATLNGTIEDVGGGDATSRGFAWGTSATMNGDTATTTDTAGQPFGTGTFTDTSVTYSCGTTYYSRAYATNGGGTGFGSISPSFTTTTCIGSPDAPKRVMRLFQGFRMKIISGKIILNQFY